MNETVVDNRVSDDEMNSEIGGNGASESIGGVGSLEEEEVEVLEDCYINGDEMQKESNWEEVIVDGRNSISKKNEVLGRNDMGNDNDKVEMTGNVGKESKQENVVKGDKSYANVAAATASFNDFSKKLIQMPVEIDEQGNEFVLFDETIISEGCRFGFKDIVDVNNGIYFIKFHNTEGLEAIVESGPWMVNSKPFFVQKWDIHVCLDKKEPEMI
ncbi:zinc knuckle CX2CX4HX4C containing protein, partial [Tanacetum coccineum]